MEIITKLEKMQEEGNIIYGIAPIDRYNGIDPRMHPLSILPDAQSVIVVAVEIPRGQFRGIEEGTLWGPSSRWAPAYAEELVEIVEDEGWDCVPYIPQTTKYMPRNPVRAGGVAPNVSLSIEYAAIVAGIGEIGYHNMFLTKKFGIRQALAVAITNAQLPATPISNESICTKCKQCAKMCPLGAISETESSIVEILGKKMEIGIVNEKACKMCPNGTYADSTLMPGWEELLESKESQLMSISRPVQSLKALNRLKASCGRACIASFESDEMRKYKHKFRIREPWALRPEEMEG